jgi:hypothetical protein
MKKLLVVGAIFGFVAPGCGGDDDGGDGLVVSCSADGICQSVCANDPDCASAAGSGDGGPGSGGIGGGGGESGGGDAGGNAGGGAGGSGGSAGEAICVPPREPVQEPEPACNADDECDDGNICTTDGCSNGKCRHTHTSFGCGSAEVCDPRVNVCVAGPTCSTDDGSECADEDECTVNERCDLSYGWCRREILDSDSDGHPPVDCGGDDFDDEDGDSYPGAIDICDGKDNDNNGKVDDEPEASRSCNYVWNEVPACKEGRCSQGCRSESDQQGLQYVHEECNLWDDPPCTYYTIPEMIWDFGDPFGVEILFQQHGVTTDLLSQDCIDCIVNRSVCVYNCDCWLPYVIGPTPEECDDCQITKCIRPFEDCAGIPDLLIPGAPVCGQDGAGGAGGDSQPDENCLATVAASEPGNSQACNECVCLNCRVDAERCFNDLNASDNSTSGLTQGQECQNLVSCGKRTGCQATDCYCVLDSLDLACEDPFQDGPCKDEVEATVAERTESENPNVIANTIDPGHPISTSREYLSCTRNLCSTQCY